MRSLVVIGNRASHGEVYLLYDTALNYFRPNMRAVTP